MNSKINIKIESIKMTIITIATVIILVIIFAGVTYTFFTVNNPEESTAQIISGHGTNDDADFETIDKIYLLSAKEVWNGTGTTAKD